MRYYAITITRKDGSVVNRYTSYVNGQVDPNALNVELDIYTTPQSGALPGSYARVWGVPLEALGGSQDLVDCNVVVEAGMQKGLPLANPAQAGVIARGSVYQAFGNWQGLDMTLEMYFLPNTGKQDTPAYLVLNWAEGQTLESALRSMLSVAFPNYQLKIQIRDTLVQNYAEVHTTPSLSMMAKWVKGKSLALIGGDYPGVEIVATHNTILIYDDSKPSTAKTILFTDIIGQPTWISPPFIQFKTVMRGDLNVGDTITLPSGIATVTGQSLIGTTAVPNRDKLNFQGTYRLQSVRHVGNFRQPDANSWVTIFEAYPVKNG